MASDSTGLKAIATLAENELRRYVDSRKGSLPDMALQSTAAPSTMPSEEAVTEV